MNVDDDKDALESTAGGEDVPLAKLSMPRLARGIARPRLFNLLDAAREVPAVWIVAPGGAGKTTLVATYITEREVPFLWYQLDGDDADPATFFYYLGIAARKLAARSEAFLPLLTPEYLPDIPGFARRYFRHMFTILPRGTALVLDNYQSLIDATVFNEILRAAIGEIPDQGNIIMISRTDPPPALARQRAIGSLAIIEWEELRLTLEETEIIVSRTREFDKTVVRALYQRSEGWVAGLTLLMEQMKRKGDIKQVFNTGSLQTIFDYFANEFFDGLPGTFRDFLLKTALLSHMTPELAVAVSGNDDAAEILEDLHKRHLFTDRRDLEDVNYQYHDLFRKFLLNRGEDIYEPADYRKLMSHAALLLVECGRLEEAIFLYLKAKDWGSAVRWILEQAPQLLAQGRAQILGGWIQQMPEDLVRSTPWLLYWKGISQQFVNPFSARAMLEQADARFGDEGDTIGQMLVASAVIDIAYILRQGFATELGWIDSLQSRLAAKPVFPSLTVEAKILTSLVSISMFVRPHDPRLTDYAERLVVLLDSDEIDVNQKVWMAGHSIYYASFVRGDLEASNRIMMQIRPLLGAPELTVVNQIFWRHMCVPPYILMGRDDAAYEAVRPVLALVRENNLQFLEFIANLYEVLIYLRFDDTKAAAPLLVQMEELLNPLQPLDTAWFHFAKFIFALVSDDSDSAVDFGRSALQWHSELGIISIAMEISCILAIISCENGKHQEASDWLLMPVNYDFGGSPFIRHQVLLVEAYSALLSGNSEDCHRHLRDAFIVADNKPFFGNFFCWFPRKMMSLLSAEALRAGIETNYVRQLIRRHKLLPEEPVVDDWPWPVKIHGLGQFKLFIDGELQLAETKAQRKPINLLEILIAFGGTDVKIDRISGILWPDAEGDAAVSSFTTTLSRLRKLLGEKTIVVSGGRVSLDERRCWSDVRALERYLDEAEKVDEDGEEMGALADKIMTLYRGPFLSDEEGPWLQPLRNRLRSRVFRFLSRYYSAAVASDAAASAAGLLERIQEADPGFRGFDHSLSSSG